MSFQGYSAKRITGNNYFTRKWNGFVLAGICFISYISPVFCAITCLWGKYLLFFLLFRVFACPESHILI